MNPHRSPRAGTAILVVTTLSAFITPFLGSSVNIALPSIGRDLHLDAVTLTWVNISYMLSSAMFLLPFGRLADLYGRRRFFIVGTWLFTVFSVLAALAPSGTWLLIARCLQGAGSGMVFSTGTALLTSAFPPQERGKVLGLNVTGVYLGLTLGPVLGGLLVHAAGWRSVMWLNLPLGILILVMAYRNLPRDGGVASGKVDVPGSILFSLALGSLVVGFSRAAGPTGWILSLLSLAFFVLFVRWEGRVKDPMLDIRHFTENRVFLFSNLAALINYSSTTAVVFLLSLYLQYIKGLSPAAAGGILLVQPLVMAVLSGFTGALSDRVSPRLLASAGMGITVAGLTFMAFMGASTPLSHVTGVLVLLGVGFGIFSSPNTNSVMGSVQPRHLGVASAALGTMRMSGQVLSMGFAALVLSLVMGNSPIVPENHHLLLSSLRLLSGLFAVFCFGGIFVSLARGQGPALLTVHSEPASC
jgi:EmrB/QacA subfamily drug resistance transporter